MRCVRLVLGVSAERGVEQALFAHKAIDGKIFTQFLTQFDDDEDNRPAVFIDNASYHKSKVVMKAYENLDVMPIFNVPYRPDLNPIKEIFGQIKSRFRRKRLTLIASCQDYDPEELVKGCIEETTHEAVKNTV